MRHSARKRRKKEIPDRDRLYTDINCKKRENNMQVFSVLYALISVKASLFIKFAFPSTKFGIKTEMNVDRCWNGTDMG